MFVVGGQLAQRRRHRRVVRDSGFERGQRRRRCDGDLIDGRGRRGVGVEGRVDADGVGEGDGREG